MKHLYTALFSLFVFSFLHGQESEPHTIITDRPDQTEASSVVPAGSLQIESGMTFTTRNVNVITNRGNVDGVFHQCALPNTLLRLGVTENFELRFITQPEMWRIKAGDQEILRQFGIADFEVGFKVNFFEANGGWPEVGLLSHLLVPTGTEEFSNGQAGVINKLAFTHFISDKHTLAYNIGLDYFGDDEVQLFYSLAWAIALTDKLGVYLEPYGFKQNNEDSVEANADAGFTYLFTRKIQFDYSFGLGLNENMNYHSVGLSILLQK